MVRGIEQFSEQLKEDLNLVEELNRGDGDIYTLRVDSQIVIQYADLKPGLNLISVLGSLPKENLETLLMSIMRINLFGKGTQGGVLGYDKETKQLIFSHAYPFEMTYREFKEALEDFINLSELWIHEFNKVKRGEASLLSQ